MKITQAFIFAAGRGKRMMPLTKNCPKPLLKIANKPIINYIIEKLNKVSSIEKIIINGFYLSDKIEKHLSNLSNSKLIFSKEIEQIETGGALLFAKDKYNFESPILTINGDLFWQNPSNFDDLEYLISNFDEKNSDILMGIKESDKYFGYDGKNGGDFIISNKKIAENVRELLRSSKNSHAFVGIQIINPKILLKIKKKAFSLSDIYKLSENETGILNKIHGIELKGNYFHIGTPRTLEEASKKIANL